MTNKENRKHSLRIIFKTVLVIVAFASIAAAQSSGQPSVSTDSSLITDFEVNGLKVIVKRRPNAPTVSAGLFIRGGVQNATENTAGLESLTLSVATEASKKFPRTLIRKELTRMASAIGAGSNQDFSVVSLNSTRPNFERTWEIFTDAVMNPLFSKADFELVKTRQLTALKNSSISPDSALDGLQKRVVYANHPYSNDPDGTPQTIEKMTLAELRAYHKKVMQTSRLLLVIVGDVEQADIRKLVTATLGTLPRGSYQQKKLPDLKFEKASLEVSNRAVETNYIKGIFAAPSLRSPDYYAMRVAMTILQSKVVSEVRNKRQLSYAPNAEMDDSEANTANIYVTTAKPDEAVGLMLEEIRKLRKDGVDSDQFTGLPGYFLTTYFLKQETNSSQVAELARYELIGGGWRDSLKFIDNMLAVKPADVKRVAEKYMKNIRFVVIGEAASINRSTFLP